MNRIAIALLLAASLCAGAPAIAQTLRPTTTVTGPVLRLGDLFADAGSHADEAVAPAPAPGMRVTYNADWLAAIAHEHNLDWSPSSGFDQATVERASRTIAADAIAAEMLNTIAARQNLQDAELLFDNPSLRLTVAADAPDTIAVDGLTLDDRTGRVTAFVSAPAGDPAAARQRVTGRLVYRVDVPMPNRALAPNAVIAAGDLDIVRARRDRIAADVVTDVAALIGKTPRRPLKPGEPVRLGDVQFPILVHKNEIIAIVLQAPGLEVSTQGKALDDGAMGALIRVENTKSGRVIDATIAATGTVTVSPSSATAALAAATAQR